MSTEASNELTGEETRERRCVWCDTAGPNAACAKHDLSQRPTATLVRSLAGDGTPGHWWLPNDPEAFRAEPTYHEVVDVVPLSELQASQAREGAAQELIEELKRELWSISEACGCDMDGSDWRHVNPGEALRDVRQLRQDYEVALADEFDRSMRRPVND